MLLSAAEQERETSKGRVSSPTRPVTVYSYVGSAEPTLIVYLFAVIVRVALVIVTPTPLTTL